MTAQTLRAQSLKDLTSLARKRGVLGWHGMRKDQLVRALLHVPTKRNSPVSKSPTKKSASANRFQTVKRAAATRSAAAPARNGSAGPKMSAHSAQITKRLQQAKVRLMRAKILSTDPLDGRSGVASKDRLVVMVRGPYWLHAYWELSPASIVRAQAALGQHWHSAAPVLRLIKVSGHGSSTAAERPVRDIPIHGGVRNWYIDVTEPPQTYRLEIGYLASNGKFFSLARSNMVSTPATTSSEKLDQHWTEVVENCDKIYAMSGGYSPEVNSHELQEVLEERLRRPVGTSLNNRFSVATEASEFADRSVRFRVEAEMVIHGVTQPDANVTLQGAPVKLRPDGSFSVQVDLPNRRQVIPLVATTKDGASQRTIILAVERNTKVMEPLNREANPAG